MTAEQVRFRFVAPLRSKTPPETLTGEVAFLPMEAIGADGTYDHQSIREASEISGSGYTYFEEGDLVRARVTPCFENGKGALLSTLANGRGLGTTELFVFKPSGRVDPRYLYYVTTSLDFTAQGTATMYGAHGVRRVDDGFARDYRVWLPSISRQRAIVAYLDWETARIDALLAASRSMVNLVEERWQGTLETSIQSLARAYGEVPLKYACRELSVGIVVRPAAWYTDSGVPALRGGNIEPGNIILDDLVFLTAEGHALHPKSKLRAGDVVVVRTGQAGAAAVVPRELDGANCIDLVIVRPKPNYSPYFLMHVINSDWMQKHIREHSVGTIQSHFNVGAAAAVPIPNAPRAEQDRAVAELDATRQRVLAMIGARHRQIDLLRERRQALIAAVVTGQLDIPESA